MTPFFKGIHDNQEFFVMNLVVTFGKGITYENENELDEEDYLL
jgi:hypothetical protein